MSCGPGARNLTTDNISARHLLNIHRVVRPRANAAWLAREEAAARD